MQLHTMTLASGSRFFIVQDFFELPLYRQVLALFDTAATEDSPWWQDPRYSHLSSGRWVYRGTSAVRDQLDSIATAAAEWISSAVGHAVEYHTLDLWQDQPGYTILPHYDTPGFEYALQIYVPDPANFFEQLGTCVYTDSAESDPLFEIHYRPNRGYLIDRTNTVRHGLHHAVPAGFCRQSVYIRYRAV